MADDIWGYWLESDLIERAKRGDLAPAFEVDSLVDRVVDICTAGKCPIVVGESGVGKTALIGELARQLVTPSRGHIEPLAEQFEGYRLLQLSFRRRAVSLKKAGEEMGEEMGKLVDAILAAGDIIPYFRDIEIAYQFDLEPLLESLAFRLDVPVIGEGYEKRVQRMLEYNTGLQKHYVTLKMQEPNLESARKILDGWCAQRPEVDIDPGARSQAVYLSHRFLSRSRMPRKVLDLMTQVVATTRGGVVGEKEVIERFSQTHQVPTRLIDPDVPLDLSALSTHFESNVLGQSRAVQAVVDVIGLIKAGLSDPRRPFGVFLFAGPTGVGKTHLAQLLAEYLFGGSDRMIRINMTDFADDSGPDKLFGNAHGHGVAVQRGILTTRVSGTPFAVLLLDEFEKAHSQVHDRLLQLIDEGEFINGMGETVSCRSMIIIATSNAGAEVYRAESFGFQGRASDPVAKSKDVERRLHEVFRYEFLNRFDRIVHFFPLKRGDIREIALREMKLLGERIGFKQRKLQLSTDDTVLDWLATHGYHPNFGARFLRRVIERHVASSIAGAIVRENPAPQSEIAVTVRGAKVAAYVAQQGQQEVDVAKVAPAGNETPRDLSREEIVRLSQQLLDECAPLLDALAQLRNERSKILDEMGKAEVWSKDEERESMLERFQDLDLRVRMQESGERAVKMLTEAIEENFTAEGLAKRYQRMLTAKSQWEMRLAETGAASVWLVIAATDALRDSSEIIEQLTEAELAWCKRLSLEASVVGYAERNGALERVYLDVVGPGAGAFLRHESGIHRFYPSTDNHTKAAVGVFAQNDGAVGNVRVKRRRSGRFGVTVDGEAVVTIESRGIKRIIVGTNGAKLEQLAAMADSLEPESSHVVRVYGKDGVGARDPDTGATVPKLRDAMLGHFDRFLEARRHLERA